MNGNPLLTLQSCGQSIWLDFIQRGMIASGALKKLIQEEGLRGVTSNPSIFEKAISGSDDYDESIRALTLEGKSVQAIYEFLTVRDIQEAADIFRPVYEETRGRDGLVSLEVSPHLAYDTSGTVAEAHRLWSAVDRPNVMIKVPGTENGLPAVQQLIREGINVNVTLLFGLPRYKKVAEAYIAGLEARLQKGLPIENIASVASFFLSRIDVLADPVLEKWIQAGGSKAQLASRLHGQVAVSSAKVAYQVYKEIFSGGRFKKLALKGARTQRLLWASTSTKNPSYSDVKYVELLIGPETVNTVTLETLNNYRDHGSPSLSLEENVNEARSVLDELADLGIDIDERTQALEDEGVVKFIRPYDRLLEALKKKQAAVLREPVDLQALEVGDYQEIVEETIRQADKNEFSTRFWSKDTSLWKSDPENQRVIKEGMGWLHVAEKMAEDWDSLRTFSESTKAAGFGRVVHLGMGGSSLAPLVFQLTFSPAKHGLPLFVLDTTDPATILSVEREAPVEQTLFIVASKSGTTAETSALGDYFYEKLRSVKKERAGENFVAITDPGTPLAALADKRKFRKTFLNFKDIGGRYSALSYFGLVPAALMGIDVEELVERALRMQHACSPFVPAIKNPGLRLGAAVGELAKLKIDKLTFLLPEPLEALGMWLEQLLAESTGKDGLGILPVAGERLGVPSVYGDDRVFVYLRQEDERGGPLPQNERALEDAGFPLVRIHFRDFLDLGQEFIRWEIATATASSILGINAFDQPNVQESKNNTDRLLKMIEEKGAIPEGKPSAAVDSLRIFSGSEVADGRTLVSKFFSQVGKNDYVAVQAYIPEKPGIDEHLQELRITLRDHLHVATTLGYGPRFLHSTGQFHKGGPNTGLFLQLTADDHEDIPIPGKPYTFSLFKRAQALGDLEALRRHDRRVMRVHLGSDIEQGLREIRKIVREVLAGGR
jgi:transaldolase/glucose-6-phosphate isomerase